MDRVDEGTGATGHRGRWTGLVVGGAVLAVLAVAGAFTASPAAGAWVLAALAAALLLGGGAAAWAGRGPAAEPAPAVTAPTSPPAASAAPVREVDDLQAFFEAPPGTTDAVGPTDGPGEAVAPATTPAPATTSAPASDHRPSQAVPAAADEAHRTTVRRIAVGATAALLVVVVGAAVAAALTRDETPRGGDGAGRVDRDGSASPTDTPTTTAPSTPTSAPAPFTAAAAGDLAGVVVSPGRDGLEADLVFEGIVLEPRAVGSTVTRPGLALSTDGRSGVAHLELPTWNCLSATAPADPAAAGCTPGPTEYADLGTPTLRVDVAGGDFELTGDFPTYTRPNGSPPAYTGRTYAVTVTGGPAGEARGEEARATGELGLGGATTGTRTDTDVNLVRVPG
ncbi:hypothetical protein F1C76_04735 [Geodermatophilaceae bacterium NBWT11]|nr:hypothetical protein F1C76_04735 [Geodermatophilaceae bacterium NBWT11]